MKFVLLVITLLLAVVPCVYTQARYDINWGTSESAFSPIVINATWETTNYFVWHFIDANTPHSVVSTNTIQGNYQDSQLVAGFDASNPNNYPFQSGRIYGSTDPNAVFFYALFEASSNTTPPGVYYFRDQVESNLTGYINLISESAANSVAATPSGAATPSSAAVSTPSSSVVSTLSSSTAATTPSSVAASTSSTASRSAAATVATTPSAAAATQSAAASTPSSVASLSPSTAAATPSSVAASTSSTASRSAAATVATTPSAAAATPTTAASASASISRAVASVAASISASASRAVSTPSASPQATTGGGGGNNGQQTSSLSASVTRSSTVTPSSSPCTKDTDGDGVPDCFDLCPRNAKKTAPSGPYGCRNTPKSSHTKIEFDFDVLAPMNCTDLFGDSS